MLYEYLYFFSITSMLIAYYFSRLHGKSSELNQKYRERLHEFGRNAAIQFSAMLFALATAVALYTYQSALKKDEKDAQEKQAFKATVADRSSNLDRALRRSRLASAPYYSPACVFTNDSSANQSNFVELLENIDKRCIEEISKSIESVIARRQKIEDGMKSVLDTITLRDDWVKNPFFAEKFDDRILEDFSAIEGKMYLRQTIALNILDALEGATTTKSPNLTQIKALINFDLSMDYFTKSALIYSATYYVTFGDTNLESRKIRDNESNFMNVVRNNQEEWKHLNLQNFINRISQELLDCKFKRFSCFDLISRYNSDPAQQSP